MSDGSITAHPIESQTSLFDDFEHRSVLRLLREPLFEVLQKGSEVAEWDVVL
jgi:hypothetical protein